MVEDQYRQTFRRLISYTINYKSALFVALMGMLGYAAIDVMFISKLQPFIDDGLTNRDPDFFKVAPLFVIGAFIVRGICNFCAIYFLNWVGTHVIQTLRGELFERIVQLPVAFHDQTSAGNLISKITFDTEQIQQACSKALITMIREGAFVIGLLAFMFYESWRLSLVFLIITPFIAIIVKYVTKRFRRISHNIQNTMGDVTQASEQMIRGHKVILGFGGQRIEIDRFDAINKRNRQQKMKMESTKAVSVSLIQILASLALAAVVYMAGLPGILDTISTGTFMSIITAMIMLLRPLKLLTTVNSEFQRGMSACLSVFEAIDQAIEQDDGQFAPQRVQGNIQLNNVNFTYPTKELAIFDNLNLTIHSGQTVALVGRSGSGKSTISNLLPRYYRVNGGSISIDGTNINDFNLAALRKQFAMVSQQVVLFNDSIANNITYGYEQPVSTEQLRAIAAKAHVTEFVDLLPLGFDTLVGENGVMLSGGQRQRIAIARALLRDAPILILDEATSALDTESEKVIQLALEELKKNRTSIVIAHRLSTIENADIIVVIEAGKIIEQGSHQMLMQQNGAYKSLYTMQFGDVE